MFLAQFNRENFYRHLDRWVARENKLLSFNFRPSREWISLSLSFSLPVRKKLFLLFPRHWIKEIKLGVMSRRYIIHSFVYFGARNWASSHERPFQAAFPMLQLNTHISDFAAGQTETGRYETKERNRRSNIPKLPLRVSSVISFPHLVRFFSPVSSLLFCTCHGT